MPALRRQLPVASWPRMLQSGLWDGSSRAAPLRYAVVDGMNVRDPRVHNYPPRWNAEACGAAGLAGEADRPLQRLPERVSGRAGQDWHRQQSRSQYAEREDFRGHRLERLRGLGRGLESVMPLT
jgi:hypothetical protein